MSRYFLSNYGLLTVLFLMSWGVIAAQTGDSLDFNFRGTLIVRTPCEINGGQSKDILFHNVGIKKVNGINYTQTIPYTVVCTGMTDGDTLHLSVISEQTVFDQSAIVTSADGLGIKIMQNGQPMKINEPLAITLNDPPKLTAVPVKDPNRELIEQTFTAAATLKADYE